MAEYICFFNKVQYSNQFIHCIFVFCCFNLPNGFLLHLFIFWSDSFVPKNHCLLLYFFVELRLLSIIAAVY